MKPPRPFSVTLLAIGVLTLAVVGIIRSGQAISLWDFLTSLDISPIYLAMTGLLAGLVGLPVAWGLWWGLPWTPRLCMGYVLALFSFYWIDRLFLTQSLIGSVNTPFAVGVTILVIGFMTWVFHREKSRDFFTRWRPE
jgi:hypothetical protein